MDLPLIQRKLRPLWMIRYDEEETEKVVKDRDLGGGTRTVGEEWVPAFSLYEKDGNYVLNAEIPGVSHDVISVRVHKDLVTVSGRKESKTEGEGANYYLQETGYGFFSRNIRIPGEIEKAKVTTTIKDGVLTLVMPRKRRPRPNRLKSDNRGL